MFEDSLVESQVTPISATKQWTTLGSFAIQSAVALALIALPLLHPQRLPVHLKAPAVFMPPRPRPVTAIKPAASSSSASPHVSAPNAAPAASLTSLLSLPGRIADPGPEPTLSNHDSMGDDTALPDALTASSRSPSVTVTPPHSDKPLPISGGVSAGMLLNPIRPVYPAIARAARVEGTVVVDAVISRTGTIESLRVIRGPAVLQQAAIEAIKAARYQPYRLNGEPTDVQTTITVNFRLEN